MKEYEFIISERDGQIARIILNRPEKLNAIHTEMGVELLEAISEAEADDDVKVIVLKGAGRAFCAGFDLSRVYRTPKGERRPSQRQRLHGDLRMVENFRKVLYCWKPTIAQVHGICTGGGFYYQLMADITIAAEDAQIGHLDQRMGFAGATPGLMQEISLMGYKRTRELVLTGRLLSGSEASQWGLVNRAVPKETLDDEVQKLAEAICMMPRDGIAIGKTQTRLAYERMGFGDGLIQGQVGHTLFTNVRWEPDEYNFIRERQEHGTKSAFHERDSRYAGLLDQVPAQD